MRIQIIDNRSKTYLRRYKSLFERLKVRFICKFVSISMLLDPDPHSQYGSGSRTAKSLRIRIHNTGKI
jgi:hypothetical protein